MAETIILRVELQGEEAVLASLNQIDTVASALASKPITLSLSGNMRNIASEMGNAAKQAENLGSAVSGAASPAVNRNYGQLAKVTQDYAGDMQQLLRTTQEYNTAVGKTTKVVTDNIKGEVQSTRVIENQAKAQAAAAKAEAASVKEALDYLNAQEAMRKAAAANAAPTPLQEQINRITGVTREAQPSRADYEALFNNSYQKELDAAEAAKAQAAAQKEQAKAAKEASKSNQLLGDSLGNIALKMAAWQVMGNVVAGTINAFKDAVGTIKDVDTELTNIQKVTDLTNDQIKELGDSAYSTASKYGVSANEYLEAAGNFAKAGYDNFDALAELAIKTQLVGDVTAQTASQFLLSADAAFKFEGNVEDLSTVLDKANVIENNYATSIDKIAAGLPIVASTASLANMSIDETMAALGTITSVTQETGTKAATALRALILNILGDTTTEVEDGVTVTTDQIKNLSDALEKYAPEAVEAARAAGKVIDPMTALASLSEAFQEGVLSEAELIDILSDVGGKLRTNELAALVENWGMFEEMLGKTASSAGSADKEVETMLSSWEAKTNILKNSWTELVSNFVNTDFVKDRLDTYASWLNSINDFISPDKETKSYEAQLAELEQLRSKTEELSEVERRRLAYLEAQEKTLVAMKMEDMQPEFDEFQSYYRDPRNGLGKYDLNATFQQSVVSATEEFKDTWDIDSYRESLQGIVTAYSDVVTQIQDYKDAGFGDQLSADQLQLVDYYNALLDALAGFDEFVKKMTGSEKEAGAGDAADDLILIEDAAEKIPGEKTVTVETEGTDGALDVLAQVNEASADKTMTVSVSVTGVTEAISQLGKVGAGYASGTDNAPAGPALVNEEGPEIISDNGRAFIANGGKPAIVNLHQGAVVIPANETRNVIKNSWQGSSIPAYKTGLQSYLAVERTGGIAGGIITQPSREEAFNEILGIDTTKRAFGQREKNITGSVTMDDILRSDSQSQKTWYGGGGSSKPSINFKALENELDEALDLIDAQIRLAKNQGDMEKVLDLQDDAQNRIADLLEKYRANGYADTSKEVLDLANKGYGYADDQLGVQDDLWEALIDSLNDLYRSTEESNDLEEKQLAVEKARETLENTRNQRTVRIFNPVTGQWEWVANAADIQSAQERLESAEKALRQEQITQELDALEKSKGTDLDNIVLGPGLSALLNGADEADTAAVAASLGALTGTVDRSASTDAKSLFSSVDSHDNVTSYTFPGGITISEEQAQTMTLAELARQLNGLNLTTEMPA